MKPNDPGVVYIGRATRNGWKRSKWHNPFKPGRDGTREECVAKYVAHLKSRPDLVAALPELAGKVLGCWCKPLSCHGDALDRLANGSMNRFLTRLTDTADHPDLRRWLTEMEADTGP
jgi:hypothetical protein